MFDRKTYIEAMENAFGMNVDVGMIIKSYGVDRGEPIKNAATVRPK